MEVIEINNFGKEEINLNIKQKIKLIKNSGNHIVIVTIDNDVYVYGNNEDHQLGLKKEIKNVTDFTKIDYINFGNIKFLQCSEDSTLIVNDLNQFYFTGYIFFLNEIIEQFTLNEIKLSESIKKIENGLYHFIILTNDNFIYGLGENYQGELGLSQQIEDCDTFLKISEMQIKDVKCGFLHSIILDFYGNIFVTGRNENGQLGLDNNGEIIYEFTKVELPFKVKSIFTDTFSSFILNENNELLGTGYNHSGQLGVGDNKERFHFTKIELNCGILHHKSDIEVYLSDNEYSIMRIDNILYVSGIVEKEKLLVLAQNSCLFEKFNIDNGRKYIHPIMLNDRLFILKSDYKMNGEEEDTIILGLKCLQKLQNDQLTDTSFTVL